jgi:hypothetical protein
MPILHLASCIFHLASSIFISLALPFRWRYVFAAWLPLPPSMALMQSLYSTSKVLTSY